MKDKILPLHSANSNPNDNDILTNPIELQILQQKFQGKLYEGKIYNNTFYIARLSQCNCTIGFNW